MTPRSAVPARPWQMLPAAILAITIAYSFIHRARRALWFMPFVDETEHIVGGRVLRTGGVLYRDFVEQHGPLPYALGELSSFIPAIPQPGAARLLMLLLLAATTAAIAASPCLRGARERLGAAALFLGLCRSLWIVQGLCMLDYQPIAGMLLAVAASQFAAPAWCGMQPSRAGAFLAGAALLLVPCAAYSYAPAALLLLASASLGAGSGRFMPPQKLALAAGATTAAVAFGTWAMRNCDPGGYIAYHLVLNQIYFAPYIHFSLADLPASLLPRLGPVSMAQTMALLAAITGLAGLFWPSAMPRPRRAVVCALAATALLLCNPKGNPGFQNGAFVLLAFALAALALARLPRLIGLPETGWRPAATAAAMAVLLLGAEATARTALSSPHGYTHAEITALPRIQLVKSPAPWAQRLRAIIPPAEPFLALNFRPNVYIEADRLPLPGFDHYFPWDADYARHPWRGHTRDICAALRATPPAVIYDTNWTVWGLYAPRDYMPCAAAIEASLYQQVLADPPIYVRKDRVAAWGAVEIK